MVELLRMALSLLVAAGSVSAPPVVAEANKLMTLSKYDEAEEILAQYLHENQMDSTVRGVHADVLERLKRYHFAADEAQLALKQRPQDPELHLLMGKIWQNMHEPGKAVDEYNNYLRLAGANDARKQQYQTLITVLQSEAKDEAEQIAAKRKLPGDYFNAIIAQGPPTRWKDSSNIRVYIVDGKGVPGYRAEFEESLRQAFDEWTHATEGKIAFRFVDKPEEAQMKVIWSDDLHAPALKAEAGHAQTRWGKDGIVASDISLLTVDPFKDGPIGKNHLYNVCLHEIGHALGLQAHSPYEDDIMSPMLYTQQGLSHRDINTILALYSEESTTRAEQRELIDEYGRPLGPEAKAQRLSREGSVAAAAGEYRKAIEKLEAALAINPKDDIARKNLAVCANNLAIANDTKKEEALELLRKALKWDPANEAYRHNLEALQQK